MLKTENIMGFLLRNRSLKLMLITFLSCISLQINAQYGPNEDLDQDGVMNSEDLDDDNDGILDTVELGLFIPGTTIGVADPIPCGARYYQVINGTGTAGQLYLLNPLTGLYITVGSPAGFKYNGMGFNETDGFLYALSEGAGTDASWGNW